jgi:hypothetical protein
LNKINPYDYLIAIQQHQADVQKDPRLWLPWVYKDRVKALKLVASSEVLQQ